MQLETKRGNKELEGGERGYIRATKHIGGRKNM
jgi:hypothetical protein